MKTLVTGGLGFIGSHLVDLLIDEGHDVTIIDDKSSNSIETDDRFNLVLSSIDKADPASFKNFDVIFHLASVVGPAGVLTHGFIGSSIIENTKIIMDACLYNNSLLVDISTSEVYGHAGDLNENSDKICSSPYQIRTEYGIAKLLAEIMIVNKAKTTDLKYHIIRPFNVAGPRQKPDGGFVLPRFVIAMLTDQPITIFGNGSQIRSFTDVRDICDAIIKIAFSKYKNEIWNVGNPANEMSITELATKVVEDKIRAFSYIDPQKLHGPLFAEAENKVANIEKLISLLDWKPSVSLKQTIKDTIEYYKAKISQGYKFDVCKGKFLDDLI